MLPQPHQSTITTRIVTGVLLYFLLLFQYQLWLGPRSIPEQRKWKQELAAQTTANAENEILNHQLQAEVDDLRSGLTVVEEKARSQLGMIGAGEIFVQFVDN